MPAILALTPASQGSAQTGTKRWTTGKRRLSFTSTETVLTALIQYVGDVVLPCLFAVLSAQIYIYYLTSAAKDRWFIKAVVYGIYALLTARVVWSGREGYNRFVSQHASQHWQGQFFVPTVGGVGSAAAITAGTFGAKAGSVENLRNSPELPIVTAIWCRTSALCDILIAAYMTYLDTKRVIVRIVRLTIETNALTAAITVITAALLLGTKDQGYYIIFFLILPSIYGNTLLAMMNSRIRLSHGSSGQTTLLG
ncbi:hypothetical protein PQX77_017164 [Marasmius sp. AFHP31]|nr:hypothetical protein PQX77_017164 [Marasmius sp. AFHP31]